MGDENNSVPSSGQHHGSQSDDFSPFALGLRKVDPASQIPEIRTATLPTSLPRAPGASNSHHAATAATPFAGRLGGNQAFTLDRDADSNSQVLQQDPDAAPGMSLAGQFDLRGFTRLGLWKAAVMEGVGSMLLVYTTMWANISPNTLPTMPTPVLGYFDNAAYLGPTTGGLINFVLLTLFTFVFGIVTGAHLNPLITIATFFARLTTLARCVLYVAFQTFGAALAGYLVRAGYGTRDFKVGGCWLFTSQMPVSAAFSVEFMACTCLLFLAFGVGLDPRQQKVIPPALSPFLVGLALGTLSWAFGYARYGFGGASMNPARCFGTAVGSHFPGFHWYYWVAPICACIFHAIFYNLIPPGKSVYKSGKSGASP